MKTGVHINHAANDFVKKWLGRIERGVKERQEQEVEWKKNEDMVYMRKERDGETGDFFQVNKLGAWVEQRVSALTYKRFRYHVSPAKPEGWQKIPVPVIDPQSGQVVDQRLVTRAQVVEAVLNKVVQHPNFGAPAAVARFVSNAQISLGVLQVGYTADFEYVEDDIEPISAEDIPFYPPEHIRESYEHTESANGEQIPMIDSQGMLVPKGRKPISEQFYMEAVPPDRMIFDPNGEQDFLSHGWCAVEILRPLAEIKKDKTLKNTENLKAITYVTDETGQKVNWDDDLDKGQGGPLGDDDREMARLYYIWDFDNGEWIVLADGCVEELRREDIPDGVDRSTGPWAFLRPKEICGKWYPHPPCSSGRPIAEAIDVAKMQEIKDMRKSSRKILFDKGKIDEDDALRLIGPKDEAIGVNRNLQEPDLSSYVMEMPINVVNPQTFAHVQTLELMFDEAMGSPSELRGVASAKTATQTAALTSGERMREEYQRAKLRDALEDAGRKLLMSMQANMTMGQYVEIAGEDGLVMAIQADESLMQGEYDLRIDLEEMMPYDRTAQQANFAKVLQIAASKPTLFMTKEGAEVVCEQFSVKDKRLVEMLFQAAQAELMMAMQPRDTQKQGNPAESEADATAQRGGMM